jgi:hypothetical protein
MKLKEAKYDTEVLDSSSVDTMAQARADKRMKRIVAQPDEQYLYAYSPNKARGEVDHPGMPCEDYGPDERK